jgi:hypothetical protein
MIHIVFQQKDVEVLAKAIELDESLAGEIIEIRDDYAVGSIHQLETEEGWQQRQDWWKALLDASPYEDNTGAIDDRITLEHMKQLLDENPKEILWIWMGQNGHDVCGYYWLISRLKSYAGRVFVLYLNNLPFINEKGQIFYPTALHQIQPKEFLKAKKLNRAITASEFEVDPDEWKRLTEENAMIRILEGGKKIESKEAGFYDDDILNGLSGEWQKGSKAVANILGKMKIKTGDVFLLWRMHALAEAGKIDMGGDPSKGWKEFEVRLKDHRPAAMIQPDHIQL